MRVGTDHQTTGEGVVLQDNLVNDTGARLPETNVVLASGTGKEVVNFPVDVIGTGKILLTTNLGLNQVVTVHGGGGCDGRHSSRHELQDGHLSSGILASNTVRAHPQVGLSTLDVLTVRVVKVRVENLLSVGERAAQPAADNVQVLRHLPTKLNIMLATCKSKRAQQSYKSLCSNH